MRIDTKYERLIARAQAPSRRRRLSSSILAMKHRCAAPMEAAGAGIIVPILVGPAGKVTAAAREHGVDISRCEIVDVPHSEAAAAKAVAARSARPRASC